MKKLVLFILLSVLLACHVQARRDPAETTSIKWYEPKSDSKFTIEGLPWLKSHGLYRRLPADPQNKEFREPVNSMADCPAGAMIRFTTTSKKIVIRATVGEETTVYDMPATAKSGIDGYVREGSDSEFRFCGVTNSTDQKTFEQSACQRPTSEKREYILNLPLYNSLKSLEIGLEEGSTLEKSQPHTQAGKLIVYGTSITQGAAAERPGLTYVNLLGRGLDMEVVNLGFSSHGTGDPAVAHRIAEIDDISAVILDYEANGQETIKTTMTPFIDIIRSKYPKVPIIVLSQIKWTLQDWTTEYAASKEDLKTYQKNLVEARIKAGDKNIYFIDGSKLLGGADYGEGLTVGSHPNALGMVRMADGLRTKLKKVLGSK